MTDPAIPPSDDIVRPVSRSGHETVSYAVFLDYRARRMRAPVTGGAVPAPDLPTTPEGLPPPGRGTGASVVPITHDR